MNAIKNPDYYKTIVENLPEGIIILNSSFCIVEVNQAFEILTGFNKNDILQKKSSEIIVVNKNNCPVCTGNTEAGFIPELLSHHAEIKGKDGNLIPIRISHKALESGEYILVISALSDIAFLNQAHIDFVSTVSHELRTPLTSIKGFADTILTAGDRLDKEQQHKFISIIKSQVDRLTRLVENLLIVSRLESKKDKIIYKAINFEQFIMFIVQILSHKTQNHKVETDIYPNLPPVWADSDKLEQIMTNLIDNAIKYSNPGTKVIVSAAFAPDNPDFIEIKVKDQGIGIPQDHLDKIFSKFSRIDNPLTRQVQGTGLGLYITRSLVESMGGKISAISDSQGTTFTVKLPIATPEKHAAQKFIKEKR